MQWLVKMTLAASAEGKDPRREVYKFVLNYNNSTHSSTSRNPDELLMSRKVKTLLPQKKRKREDKEVRPARASLMVPYVASILVGFSSRLDRHSWLCLAGSRLAMLWWIGFTCL